MTLRILTFLFCIILMGCSRQYIETQSGQTNPFYFSTVEGGVYEYSGDINQLSPSVVRQIKYFDQVKELFTASSKSLNLIAQSGLVSYQYEPKEQVVAATASNDRKYFFYVDKEGQLYRFNNASTENTKIPIPELYPRPKQITYSNQNKLYYHDGFYIYEINLNNNTVNRLTHFIVPVSSIDFHENKRTVYFSNSTDGKIYFYDTIKKITGIAIKPMSTNGSLISINNKENKLYYSKSNGRDTIINAYDLNLKTSSEVTRLYNIQKIKNLSF